MNLTEEVIKNIIQFIPGDIAVYFVRSKSRIETYFYSPGIPAISGYEKEEYEALVREDGFDIVLENDRPVVRKKLAEALNKEKSVDVTYRIRHKEKGFVWIRARARHLGELDGIPVLLAEFLSASNETDGFANLMDQADNMVYVCDNKTWEIYYANESAFRFWGRRDYAGKTCFHFVRGKKAPCPFCAILKMNGNFYQENEHYDPDMKRYFRIVCRRVSWYGRDCTAQFITDITEEKNSARLLETRNEEMDRIVANIPMGVAVIRVTGTKREFLAMNPYYRELLDVPENQGPEGVENLDRNMKKIHPDDLRPVIRTMGAIAAGHAPMECNFRIRLHGKGEYSWLHLTSKGVPQADGSVLIFNCLSDVTEDRENELALRKAEETEKLRYQNTLGRVVELNPNALCMFRLNLSRNTCSTEQGTSRYARVLLSTDTADALFRNIAAIIGDKSDRELFRKEFNREKLLRDFSEEKTRLSLQYRRRTDSGEIHWVRSSLIMARNPDTGEVEAILYSVDINEEQKEESIIQCVTREEFDSLAIISLRDRTVRFRNLRENAQETTPHKFPLYDEDIRYAFRIVDPENWEADVAAISLDRVIAELEKNLVYTYAFSMHDARGTFFRKLLKYCYVDDLKQEILLSRNDITEEYERHNRQLEETKAALLAADRANQMKSDFLSSVSHDMRTPLNGIIGFTNFAMKESDPVKKQDYLEKISSSGKLMLDLINDTLELSRIESGKYVLNPEAVNSRVLAETIVTALQPAAELKGVTLSADPERFPNEMVWVDRQKVQKLILNLLSNAIKFTPAGGTVWLSVEHLEPAIGSFTHRIRVKDTGIGISREFIPRMFEPFSQESRKESGGIMGTGLGMSIAKRIVDLMGGLISVNSEIGKGTEFTVLLPVKCLAEAPEEEIKIRKTAEDLSGKNVLILEDNTLNAEILKMLLDEKKVKSRRAANGREGLALFKQSEIGEYDAILTDIRMPEMDGYEAVEKIRALERADAGTVPIIAMTANAFEEDIKKCMQAGMNAHIVKPIDPDKLYETLSLNLAAGTAADAAEADAK